MSRILLIHGWCLDASLWTRVIEALPGHQCDALDFGYFGSPRMEIPDALDLIVGHSFGCLWAMQRPEFAGIPLLAVSGFHRFSAAPGFPHGTPIRVLERMLRRLRESPQEVLEAFLLRCGGPPLPATFDLCRLNEDLERLLNDDARALQDRQPRRALCADDDPLLPVPLSEAMFPATLQRLPQGGHLLPLTAPRIVAGFIQKGLDP